MNIVKLIGMNSTFAQIIEKLKINKMSENLKNFETFKEKKSEFNPLTSQKLAKCSSPLSHDNKYTKLGKIGEKLLLILGLAHINIPL